MHTPIPGHAELGGGTRGSVENEVDTWNRSFPREHAVGSGGWGSFWKRDPKGS